LFVLISPRKKECLVDIKVLDTTAHGPVYLQIRIQISELIASGKLASGDALPSPSTLSRDLSVDRGEVSRAYFELEQEGMVSVKKSKNFLGEATTNYYIR
jgi:DNA-binding transcriptional regulator YhcF (GntR family)